MSPEGPVGVEVEGNLRFNNENAIRQALLAGLGIGLLPAYMVGADVRAGALQVALKGYSAAESSIYAVYLSNRQVSAKVRVFIDFLVARYLPSPPWQAD